VSRAPRVLVSGVVLGQPMGGVVRHNCELLPRVGRLLGENGGCLAVLEGRERIAFDLPESIQRITADVPAHPVLARAVGESNSLRWALRGAAEAGVGFDLVHTAHLPAPRRLEVPFTITIHDLRALSDEEEWTVRRVVAKRAVADAVSRAKRVFNVSRTVAAEMAERFPDAAAKVTVIGNGVDHFVPMERVAGVDAPIVCVGHVEQRKNLELVVRALAADPGLPRVELHGAPKGDEADRLHALAASLGVGKRVRFVGRFAEKDLPRILASAACVCLPSKVEGFGIVALEAQVARVPLAIARAGALVEVAGGDVPSFGVDDAVECARAMRAAMAKDVRELERDAVRARGFTWDAAAKSWYEGLCAAM
jgi:glycosyltransferase involved in cell wall biosynthesis